MDAGVDGCICYAIPPKMFSRLVGAVPAAVPRHARHAGRLRSLRHEPGDAEPSKSSSRRTPSARVQRRVYDARSGEVLPGRLLRTERGRPSRDAAANEAFDNAGIALAFLREVLGRHSLDGRGMPVVSAVHYGVAFPNAFWNGRQMIYGDGDENVAGFTACLDIVAHELAHGVTQSLIPGGLGVVRVPVKEREFREQRFALRGQAGALNESFSDVMATLTKQWHRRQTVREADWLIGAGLLARGRGRAVRSLRSPGNRRITWAHDDQMHSMAQYYDGCDVHDASGIANHAFYQAALRIGGRAWEVAGPLWFEAYDNLRRDADFATFAHSTLAVAARRHGAASPEHLAVQAAWRKVAVLA